MSEPKLDDLLDQWSDAFDEGRDVPVAELCRDCPDLADELGQRIDAVRRMTHLVEELSLMGSPSSRNG